MRATRTYTTCDAIGETDGTGIVGRVWLEDYSHNNPELLPQPVRDLFGTSAREFASVRLASEWLFEQSAIIIDFTVFTTTVS